MKLALGLILTILIASRSLMAAGIVVLGGGGPEGDIGVTSDWSYALYKKLIDNGDVTGDKKINVVVISLEQPDTNFIINYFKSMGADSSVNLVVGSKKEASERKINIIDNADVLFIRGGNQSFNYQYWKDTPLQKKIQELAERGGAIGGTSSGSMVVSEYTMTGGRDYNSPDILQNSHSVLLRDIIKRKSTGIHNDFLKILPDLIVDTHCAQRARLGRILGVHAKTIEDYQDKNLISICLEERTGITIKDKRVEVYGTGIAHFIQETQKTKMIRVPGTPLVYTDIRDDALTNGWVFDLEKRAPDLNHIPTNSVSIPSYVLKKEKVAPFTFESNPVRPINIVRPAGVTELYIIGDAYSELLLTNGDKKLSSNHTNALSLMYLHPEASIVFLSAGTVLQGYENGDISSRKINLESNALEVSSLILDCSECSYKSLSPFISNQDYKNKKSHSPALINMRIHAIDSRASYNIQTRHTKILVPIVPVVRNVASKTKER